MQVETYHWLVKIGSYSCVI